MHDQVIIINFMTSTYGMYDSYTRIQYHVNKKYNLLKFVGLHCHPTKVKKMQFYI